MNLFNTVDLGSLLLFYGVHISISAVFSFIASRFLRSRYLDSGLSIFVLALFFNIIIPVLGYFFTVWMVYYLLKVKYAKVLKNSKSLNMQELDREFPNVKRLFGEGSMVDLMSNKDAPKELRMKALSVVSQDMSKKNISLIKKALADKDDEIRLYSFSLIDKMEQELNTKIHKAKINFTQSKEESIRLEAARELAYLYWDMVYFDISDDVLKEFLLEKSLYYANEVFKKNMGDTGMNVLLGKIHLERGEHDNAITQFIIAIESGVNQEYIVPYLAELYYMARNFKSVKSLLNGVASLQFNTTMYPVVSQWKNNG